jgi:para-aminobenzoate synthetase component 1
MHIWFNKEEGFDKINSFGKNVEEFLFIISYDKSQIFVQELDKLSDSIRFQLGDVKNFLPPNKPLSKKFIFQKYPLPFEQYQNDIKRVKDAIKKGESYLLNLTYKTPIKTNLTLEEIFFYSDARFKLLIEDSFVCFSPERFIQIEDSFISTFPMKGTIDASLKSAKEKILADPKEMAEHTMIVDLMRNDLNIIAFETKVKRFRYTQEIEAGSKRLIQVSSEITASLPQNWRENLGDILDLITPAGSISGTPKRKTLEIIDSIEHTPRGFYTGVFGVCGRNWLDSAVMIRSVSNENGRFYYQSGGGITIDSDPKSEYQEMIDKIYIPTNKTTQKANNLSQTIF